MAKDSSFDIVSEYDQQELTNALDQVRRDIAARFDFKNSNTTLEQSGDDIVITTSDDLKLRNVLQLIEEKLAKRGLSPFLLDTKTNKPEAALGGQWRQVCPIRTGIDKELAKQIVAHIKKLPVKVQASIQGDAVRVSGKVRDDLQAVIAAMKEKAADWEVPLQFNNYR